MEDGVAVWMVVVPRVCVFLPDACEYLQLVGSGWGLDVSQKLHKYTFRTIQPSTRLQAFSPAPSPLSATLGAW